MSQLQLIESALAGAARRQRWARGLRGLWRGLFIGSFLSLLLLGAYHLLPLPPWSLVAASVVPWPCALAGFLVGAWRKPRLQAVARWVDDRQRLQERLSTALEVSSQPEAGPWRDLVLADAASRVKGLDPRRMLPFHLPRGTRWALVVLALSAGLGFVPEYRSKAYLQQQADRQIIRGTGQQLADLTRRTLQKRAPTLETQKNLEAVAGVGDQLAVKHLTRTEAIQDLSNVAEKLEDEMKELGKDPDLKRLEQAARNATGNETQTAAGLQKQIDALQKQMGTPTGTPEAMNKLQKRLEQLQQAARSLANNNSPGSDAEKQQLSNSLSALSREAQEMGLQLPQLDEAIQALAANQTDLVLKNLQAATTDLEKMRELAKNLQQMQQQMEKLGKDLAEQLKNGQPEIAQQTLQKMISQLNSAHLPPEQMRKMLQEVSQAVDPAGNYGKMAEYLKAASGQMEGGQQAKAAQSLAQAAKELDKLMQQMGDLQDLQDTLLALNQCTMCIASGQGWGACKTPSFKPGGRPGAGVGTWAEEGQQWKGETTGGWDNSGIERPDMDPRGHTERGPGELNDALKPSKVRGQFSPGGPMPSITLKGVSIKGASKVAFEEAAATAQSDAQSALSQEKVPRAYQGPVRDYFDDLKK